MAIQSVMVSVDGSRFSERAVPVARQLARSARASLTVVMTHEPATVPVVIEIGAGGDQDAEAVRNRERKYLAEVAFVSARAGGVPVGFRLLEGIPGAALVAELALARPDLLVMSMHGRGAGRRPWLGTVADHVIRHTSVPVLLLPGHIQPGAEGSFRRGLVLLDTTEAAESIIGPVTAFASVHQSHLTLLHVLETDLEPGDATWTRLPGGDSRLTGGYRTAQRYLDTIADRLRAHGVQVATRVAAGSGVAPTILQQLDSRGYDFVAMTSAGGSGAGRPLPGQVVDSLLRGAEYPIFLVRPDFGD